MATTVLPATTTTSTTARSLEEDLAFYDIDHDLTLVIQAIASACCEIGTILKDGGDGDALVKHTGDLNLFGDKQLKIDVIADRLMFKALKSTKKVAVASSEETAMQVEIGAGRLSVSFDPLDGSSVIGTNFSVGTIFGIFESEHLVGCSGKDMIASGVVVYGPRTTMILAFRKVTGVLPYVCNFSNASSPWVSTGSPIAEMHSSGKLFAPANLRASQDNKAYAELINYYLTNKYTLRYTGALVPDTYQLIIKKTGIFVNPVSPSCPPKLRLLYEVLPIAFLTEKAGGLSSDGTRSCLELQIDDCDQRCGACFGCKEEVQRYEEYVKKYES
eukprot:CAMPEP_0184698486 /NCGR_PEP_ID=MMETSP0313-20130426/5104_1 /TAXON_ID=2792 /ORGANISM="Porphyridium aerugineum, Strain SAG 1380-2" /LENGTH=329 /DNA_ID=CAMNT_0027157449 /DNA_START=22 /DNA_END=1011 /DNA_ORIENTATION=+